MISEQSDFKAGLNIKNRKLQVLSVTVPTMLSILQNNNTIV